MAIELSGNMYPKILFTLKCPMIRPQRYSTLQKPITGLRTTNWLTPSNFDKHSCPYLGQRSRPTHPGHFHHDLRSTTCTYREERLLSSRVVNNASSTKPRARSVTPPIVHSTCGNPITHWTFISVQPSAVKQKNKPRTCSVHTTPAMIRQLWLCQKELPAPCAKSPSQKITSR